jgi:hypothetical protein
MAPDELGAGGEVLCKRRNSMHAIGCCRTHSPILGRKLALWPICLHQCCKRPQEQLYTLDKALLCLHDVPLFKVLVCHPCEHTSETTDFARNGLDCETHTSLKSVQACSFLHDGLNAGMPAAQMPFWQVAYEHTCPSILQPQHCAICLLLITSTSYHSKCYNHVSLSLE